MCRNSKSENRNSAQFDLRFSNFNFQSSNFQFRAWVILALLGCIFRPQYGLAGHSKPVSAKLDQPGVSYRNAAAGVGYVGGQVCAGCHRDIYTEYVKTDMGRSMSQVTLSLLERIPTSGRFFEKALDRHFQVYLQGADLYQSEFQTGPDGKEVFRDTQKIEWVVGSGANGFTCVVRRGNYLFEAPVSFYTKINSWGLSPGYEFRDYGFSRPILPGCISCHSGRAQTATNGNGLYRDPPFRELAIGCENCHGPGELHVKERLKGEPLSGDPDRSIVNPAKLPSWLADNICMYCHEGGDARVLQPGKGYFDFRPGTPLDDTQAIFLVPLKRESPSRPDLLEHNFSMVLSKCYRSSGGRLSCLTCHDPHIQPSKQEAPAYYRKKCLSCHTERSCALPLELRLRKTPANDCAGCHMPKRDVSKIAHSALTNHRIVAEEEEPYPEVAFHMSSSALPDLVHLNRVPSKENISPPALTLLEAYGELANLHPEYRKRGKTFLKQVAETESENLVVLEALALEAQQEGTPEGTSTAIRYLARAIELGSTSSSDYQALASLLARSGRASEAIDVLRRGLSLMPTDAQLYRLLAENYLSLDRRDEAIKGLKNALQIFPQDSVTRSLLKKIEKSTGTY